MLEKTSKQEGGVSDAATAQDMIREAFPVARYGNAKAAVWAAYRRLKLKTERRARALWNGEAQRVDGWEMDALRRALLERARDEHARTKRTIERLERALAVETSNKAGAGD